MRPIGAFLAMTALASSLLGSLSMPTYDAFDYRSPLIRRKRAVKDRSKVKAARKRAQKNRR